MELLATRDSWWMTQCEAALLAEGVSLRWIQAEDPGAMLLDVPTSDVERVIATLSELFAEEAARPRRPPERPPLPPLLLQPAFATGLSMAVLLLVFAWISGGAELASAWYRQGALVTAAVGFGPDFGGHWGGEWWRLVTAATLHADAAHATGNAVFFLVLGWAAAERIGNGMMVVVWLFTAVAGFAASLLLSDATLTVGASGGLFGLLGLAAGHGLRTAVFQQDPRRYRLRVFGSAVMLLAFTAFSPRSNIWAHVGGFVAGMGVGLLLPRRPMGSASQWGAALVAGLLMVWCWSLAW